LLEDGSRDKRKKFFRISVERNKKGEFWSLFDGADGGFGYWHKFVGI